MMPFRFRFGKQADLFPVLALLKESGLPYQDLNGLHLENFIVAVSAGSLIGAVGMERYGDEALLRSLVVRPESRWAGIGNELLGALETHARSAGIRALYLSTACAAGFFEHRRYEVIACGDMPAAFHQAGNKTEYLANPCPAEAVCLCRKIS